MATESPSNSEKPSDIKKIKVYANGNLFQEGRRFVVNPKQCQNNDVLLTQLTSLFKPPNGYFERLCTPKGGSRVKDINQLETGKSYVCVGREGFRSLQYDEIDSRKRQFRQSVAKDKEIKPVVHNPRLQCSGRIKKIHNEPIVIHVFANEDELKPSARVLLQPRELQIWDSVLRCCSERVKIRSGCIRWLYTLDGKPVVNLNEIENEEKYVAVGSECFKQMNYGLPPKRMDCSPHLNTRLYDQGKYTKYSIPTVKQHRSRPPPGASGAASNRSSQGNSTNTSQNGSGNASKYRKQQPLPQKNNYATKNNNKNKKKNDDDVFRGSKNGSRDGKVVKKDAYDNNDGGVYRATGSRESLGANEVAEDNDTKVDLPIDQVQAEEVDDDETPRDSKSVPTSQDTQKKSSAEGNSPSRDNASRGSNRSRHSNNSHHSRHATPLAESNTRQSTPKRQDSTVRRDTPDGRENAKREDTPKRQETPQRQQTPKRQDSGVKTPNGRETPKADNDKKDDDDNAKEDQAAIKIQAGYKGYRTRRDIKKTNERKEQDAAATKIQSNYRGHRGRKDYEKQKQENETIKREDEAATKIQAQYKGYKARKDVQKKQEKSDDEKSKKENSDVTNQNDMSKEEAANIINDNLKTYNAKKELDKNKDEKDK